MNVVPTCLWSKAAFFCFERRFDDFASCRLKVRSNFFVYARALGSHHLQTGRPARPSSKGCSKPLVRAIREELSSHSPTLSTSAPAFVCGGILRVYVCVGAGRGLARVPPCNYFNRLLCHSIKFYAEIAGFSPKIKFPNSMCNFMLP